MKHPYVVAALCLALLSPSGRSQAADAFQLADGDRVVLVGSTLIEREQRFGYWETALTRRYPDKSITFRNLGWSGDTVFGDARAGFGSQADGFRHLKEHVLALKPTVLIIGYGTNESFEGPKGLPRFVKGLETLLDTFAPTKARVVLLSPLKQENLGRPLPDPAENNKNLRLYADAIRDVAKKRGHFFVDLYELLGKEEYPLTDNGIHLTAYGYWHSASVLSRALGYSDEKQWKIEVDAQNKTARAEGVRVDKIVAYPLRFQVTPVLLPEPPFPRQEPPRSGNDVRVSATKLPKLPIYYSVGIKGLPSGTFTLLTDGRAGFTFDDKMWPGGFASAVPHESADQTEQLRQTIIAKNRLYFYRWRPENETYLFGFRKHEQGKNAREIPQFDPLIAEKEKEIAKLRVPVPHIYELKAKKKP